MSRLLAWGAAAAAVAAGLAGCGGGGEELVVYSGRSEPLVKPFLEDFAEETGIDVKIRFADTASLVGTLAEEGARTRADVFIGQDAASLEQLDARGLLQPYEGMRRTPARYRSPKLTWTGVSGRARVLIVRAGTKAPASVFELAEPRWKGKLAAPKGNVSFRDWVSAIRVVKGDAFARRYLQGLARNDIAMLASHGEVRHAVARGEFDIGLVNHYYVELQKREGDDVEAVFTDQRPGGFGAVFNVASIGITKTARNADAARRLVDHLLRPAVQERFARANFEYPLLPGLSAAPGVRPLDDVRLTDVPLAELGPLAESTDELLDEVGLG